MIYFDNAATTFPKFKEVYEALEYAGVNYAFNAGRGSYKKAKLTLDMIEDTRSKVSKLLNSTSDRVVFTSSATEALNNLIYGLIKEGDEVFISPFEHNAVVRTLHNINAKILIAGNILPEVYDLANDEYIEIIDIMKREELAVLNTIATAEGAIEIAIANTNKIIHGSQILILGFGRIGKVLARKLAGLSAKVTCAARKDEDLAWIRAYGHMETNINTLGQNLEKYDIIMNTVPHTILTEERLKYVKQDCLLIDLASNPGGIDKKVAKERNLKLVWALALPGKVAPTTTAEFLKDTIFNVLKEIYKEV